MSHLKLSTFAAFEQSEHEVLAGSSFTTDNKQFLQNLICLTAESIIALEPDPNNYPAFIQQEAFLKGQLSAYKYLLDASEASEAALLEIAKTPQQ